jgi:uncharacterized phage protein (TIGR01671 family)
MREIKVRGYAVEEMIDSQWIYGTGVHKTTFTDEYAKETGKKYEYFIWTETGWVEVLGESIGQYTGLKGKNGKEIYENDITYFDGAYCIVRFGEHGVPSIEDMEYVDMATGFYLEPQETIEPFNMTVPLNEHYSKDLIVIGNIYENPELLEQHHDN